MKYLDVELTPEQEAKIKACAPITITGEFEYIPEAYRGLPEDKRPVFVLRPLTGPERVKAEDALAGTVEYDDAAKVRRVTVRRGDYILRVCQGRVLGWRKWYALDGREVPYDATLACVPSELLYELANAILDPARYVLTEEERLGFSSPRA